MRERSAYMGAEIYLHFAKPQISFKHMKFSPRQKEKFNLQARTAFTGIILSVLYVLLAFGFSKPVGFINAIISGLLGGLLIVHMESADIDPNARRYSFLKSLFIKTGMYLSYLAFGIPVIIGLVESFYYNLQFFEHISSARFITFLLEKHFSLTVPVAFSCIVVMIFILQMNRKLGQRVFFNHISGRFRDPKEVERIFMILDLRASTTIAEQLGALQFHRFVNEFFSDITEAIIQNKGIIYRYIGDQVIVVWNYDKGLPLANCIQTYFSTKSIIKLLEKKYMDTYGIVPRFSTSFHCGTVVLGEIGDIKSQLVYHGEVLHQTKEIEKLFNRMDLKEAILLSNDLLKLLTLPSQYEAHTVAQIEGQQAEKLEIYTLEKVEIEELSRSE